MSNLIKFPLKKITRKHRTISKMMKDFTDEGFSDDISAVAASILFEVTILENKIKKLERKIYEDSEEDKRNS